MAGTNRYKLATWKFYYCLKWSCYLQNIFVNPCEFLGLCWVVFRSRNFADAKRKEVVCITLGFFPNPASGNGIWALGSEISKKNGLGNGTGTPPPHLFRTLVLKSLAFLLVGSHSNVCFALLNLSCNMFSLSFFFCFTFWKLHCMCSKMIPRAIMALDRNSYELSIQSQNISWTLHEAAFPLKGP